MDYAIVCNIPRSYHSSDLRNYFSQFIEAEGFECFHFRHRPEKGGNITLGLDLALNDKCDSHSTELSELLPSQNQPSPSSSTDVNPKNATFSQTTCRSSEKIKQAQAVNTMKKDDVYKKTKTTCCVIKVQQANLQDFINMYHKKHWLDKSGATLPLKCLIRRVKIVQESGEDSVTGPKYQTREEQASHLNREEEFKEDDLKSLAELNPPAIMPNGNVGTPTVIFSELIKNCRLPPSVIKKLDLKFQNSKRKRKYGNVPMNYGGHVEHGSSEIVVKTASGHELTSEYGDGRGKMNCATRSTASTRPTQTSLSGGSSAHTPAANMHQMTGEVSSEEDNDDCEEWERHEALHDDPTNQERNKERLFEEEIELKWEKGGSGLVFYTDAQFWQEKEEGDFDEQTADDWDVDMSEYYEPGRGDKDARDFITMRQEQRRRAGIDATDRYTAELTVGNFEKHTKGFGRRLMKTQGWNEGQGLGASSRGMAEALDNDGQTPRDKTGFGYVGEKLVCYSVQSKSKKRRGGLGLISSVYDDTAETDPVEPLRRRREPYHLTYRSEFGQRFVRGHSSTGKD